MAAYHLTSGAGPLHRATSWIIHQPLWDIPAADAYCGLVSGHLCSNHSSPLLFGAAGCGWEAYIRMGIWICLQRPELGPMSESCRK